MCKSEGLFFRLEFSEEGLPPRLRKDAPEVLWVPTDALNGAGAMPARVGTLVTGRLLGSSKSDAGRTLVAMSKSGIPSAQFDIARTVDAILLEQYHDGLEPTLEMRLPFNYSLVPTWVKSLGRSFRTGAMAKQPAIHFPNEEPPFVVDWLRELGDWCQTAPPRRTQRLKWPDGCRAALAISHDVDTGWLFDNRQWLDRICDLEEDFGLYGAWYCVPQYSRTSQAANGMQRLLDRGCEIGCHGYNHDAKWPLLSKRRFDARLHIVREFAARWNMRGFRSEWLWRTPSFLTALSTVFDYDSTVPTASASFTCNSRNGCGTCLPYLTEGDMLELPLTVPMDEHRHLAGLEPDESWRQQVRRARQIVEHGGLVMLSLHPQPHQAANDQTLAALKSALEEICSLPGLWLARPDKIAEWARSALLCKEGQD